MTRAGYRHQRGFTFVELMVVVAILGIVMAVGIPGVRDLLANQRIKGAAFSLITSTMYARSEAVKRGVPVAIKAVSSDNLSTGWCVQLGSTATCDTNSPGATTLKIEQAQTGVTYTFSTTAGPISFNRAGRLAALARIEIADSVLTTLKRCITIDVGGNAKSSVGACPT